MFRVRALERDYPDGKRHVQLPPPVEWEEVWGWVVDAYGMLWLTKNDTPFQFLANKSFTKDQLNAIVRALNEMEGRDG